ncbi:ATP-grasp domain-containing protein [Paenibacillus sp. GCM10027627]
MTEWRCFIRYGEILDVRQYKGAWDSNSMRNSFRQDGLNLRGRKII